MTGGTFTVSLDPALEAAFATVAEEQGLTVAQLLRRMMREAVEKHEAFTAHGRWQRREIDDGMKEADATHGLNLSNDAIEDEWRRRKEEITRDAP